MTTAPGPGTAIPGIHLGPLVGRGAFGTVFQGEEIAYGRAVGVKVLHRGAGLGTAEHHDSLSRELHALGTAGQAHAGVIRVYRHGTVDHTDPIRGINPGDAYIVMEWADGGSLAERIQGPADDPRSALEWLEPVAQALDAVHSAGVLHRDIKPSNILFCHHRPVLADFGIAKSPNSGLLSVDRTWATLAYLAPERLSGERATEATDLYAFAATIYHVLTGHPPHAGDAPSPEVLKERRRDAPVDGEALQIALEGWSGTDSLVATLMSALDRDPSRRPDRTAKRTAHAMVKAFALKDVRRDAANSTLDWAAAVITGSPPPSRDHRSTRWPRPRQRVASSKPTLLTRVRESTAFAIAIFAGTIFYAPAWFAAETTAGTAHQIWETAAVALTALMGVGAIEEPSKAPYVWLPALMWLVLLLVFVGTASLFAWLFG